MGLLSRLKHSSPSPSTASASSLKQPQPRNETTSTFTPRPTTPTSTTHLSPNLHDTPSSSRLARPTIPPPSPSSNSITSKLAKSFKKDKSKGKEKAKENIVTGVPYESHSQASLPIPPPPGSVSGLRIVSAPNSPSNTNRRPPNGRQRRSTLLSFDPSLPPQPSSPLATTHPLSAHTRHQDPGAEEHIFDDDRNHDQVDSSSSSARRKERVTSGQFRQVGGILGQLNFEVDHVHDQPGNPLPEKVLRTNAIAPIINPTPTVVASNSRNDVNGDLEIDGGVRGMTPSITDESIVIVNKDEINQENNTFLEISSTDHDHNEANKMELLESVEKKNKFWKRQRRSSKSNADGSEIERSNSPTPRRNSRNDTSLDLTANRPSLDCSQPEARQPRPQQLRRPSSSFFHNPFTRSLSRTSLALDDNSKPDDGSFQLRGFRHVSGMMEVEGAGELENYLAHVRKEPRSSISSGDLLTSPMVGNNEIPSPSALTSTSPPVSYASTPRQPPTFPISRPASIANSLGSATGDEFISATKVSVAAFRKGIRRPSENLVTMSDSGHGSTTALRNISGQHPSLSANGNVGGIDGDLDDEDDVPLGMIRGKDMMRREKSSQSLSSMRHIGIPSVSKPNDRIPSTMFDQSEGKTSPSPAVPSRQLSPEVIDRKNTPSPNPSVIERSFTPTPNISSSDITRRGSPALGRPQDIPRKPSPNPALSFTVHRQRQGHTRNGGGSGGSGFVVKSTRLTRDDLLPKNGAQTPDDKPGSHISSTSGRSTPNPQQTDQSKPAGGGGDFVSSPEEIEPIDGYFSHLAPLIHDQPAPSTTSNRDISLSPARSSRETPSPTRAPGPPIAPLPLPQADDTSTASLKLPLPPDQMPDTPPRQPSELPLSPPNRKKLSLLEEPMKIISGLWTSPTTDDGFDPAFVLSSMDAYGGDEQKVDEPTKSSQATLAKVQTTAPNTDVEEKVRSPLSQRLAGIASSASTSNLSKPSLSHIKTSEGDRNDGYSTEKIKSPLSDSTISPITTTTTGVPKETFESSFARARKPSHKFEDTEESDEESEDESGTVESSSTTPQSKSKIKTKSQSNSNGRKRNSVERRVPHGPRKPSINNRNRKRVSSMFDTNPSAIQARTVNGNGNEDDDKPLGQGRRVIGKSPSVANLGIGGMPRSESALGISTNSTRRDNPPVGQRPKTLMELGPIVQPLKDRSSNHPTSPIASTRPKPTPSSSSYGRPPSSHDNEKKRSTSSSSTTVPTMKRSPAQTLIKLPPEVEEKRKTSTASPDSSRSATTGGSVNYQPLTPKESENRRLVRDQMPSKANKQLAYQEPKADSVTTNHTRQRSYSSMGQNQPQPHSQAGQWNMSMGYDHNQMAMMGQMPQMGMGMGMQGMDAEAIRNMMKQQWQMQFMAAAFRASEEEWERASCVSGQTNHTLPASFGQASGGYAAQQPYSSMPQMGWGGMMGQFPMRGYGYPQGQGLFPNPNQLYGYNMPPQSPGPGFGGSPSQGGMYSYGTGGVGAQSVFGGEFGPPPITPSQRFMSSTQPQPSLPSNSQQEIARNTRGRYNSSTQSHSQSVYIPSNLSSGVNASPPPPSSWGRRTGSGDWSDLPQGQGQGQGKKVRPQTQFIN